MVADDLSRFSKRQTDDSDIEEDIPVCAAIDTYAAADDNTGEEVKPLTLQTFLSAQKDDANCYLLAENADVPNSRNFYDNLGILLRRAKPDKAAQNIVPLSFRAKPLDYKPN